MQEEEEESSTSNSSNNSEDAASLAVTTKAAHLHTTRDVVSRMGLGRSSIDSATKPSSPTSSQTPGLGRGTIQPEAGVGVGLQAPLAGPPALWPPFEAAEAAAGDLAPARVSQIPRTLVQPLICHSIPS